MARPVRLFQTFAVSPVRGLDDRSAEPLLEGHRPFELIQVDGAGRVHVLDAAGQEKQGWPAKVDLLPSVDPATAEKILDDLRQTLDTFGVPAAERQELFAIVESTKKDIVVAR